MRILFLTAGMLSLCLGFIGIFLPVLPTVPFVILAAFLFSKGHPALYAWLRERSPFAQSLTQWEEQKAISRASKNKASFWIVVGFGFSLYWVPSYPYEWPRILLVLIGSNTLIFIRTRPEPYINSTPSSNNPARQ